MASFGKIATAAAKRLKEQSSYYSANKGELSKLGPATRAKLDITSGAPAVSRVPVAKPPMGSTLGNDAKNIKIRQKAETEIPEAKVERGNTSGDTKKKKKSAFSYF
jgi:hypothetical protein